MELISGVQIILGHIPSNAARKTTEKEPPEEREEEIVAKASDGQRYPLPLSLCLVVCDGERGSGPKGADDVCF